MSDPKPHILVVRFGDNDFACVVMKACEDLLEGIARSDEMSRTLGKFQGLWDTVGPEVIARALALSAWGYTVSKKASSYLRMQARLGDEKWGTRGEGKKPRDFDMDNIEETRKYLLRKIRVEATTTEFETEHDNSEVCYIDFKTYRVHLQ